MNTSGEFWLHCEDLEWKGDRAFIFEQSWKKEWIHMWQI